MKTLYSMLARFKPLLDAQFLKLDKSFTCSKLWTNLGTIVDYRD